jgi:hypothetical protein
MVNITEGYYNVLEKYFIYTWKYYKCWPFWNVDGIIENVSFTSPTKSD